MEDSKIWTIQRLIDMNGQLSRLSQLSQRADERTSCGRRRVLAEGNKQFLIAATGVLFNHRLIRMLTLRATLLFAALAIAATVPTTKAAALSFPEVKDLPVQTNLPDVLTMADGTKVKALEQWRQRREEMKEILEHYEIASN